MRLFEHEGWEIFAKYGIRVSSAVLVRSVEDSPNMANVCNASQRDHFDGPAK